MTNAVVAWDPNSGAALPAYLADALGDLGSNIPDRQNVPSLSYEGKTWTIVKDGNKHKLQSQNSDGDMIPIPIMRAVILNFNPDRGRAYYPGVYNPAQTAQPDCWSADGKEPDASSKNKQCTTCAACPQAVKGSKVQDGKEMVACGSHRMIAVAPAFDIASDPLRLKIAVTSDWDKETVEHGWFAFRQYVDFLKSKGISHTALVVTKIKFDPNTAFPKLLFALDRPLAAEEIPLMKQALANPKVAELLAEKWSAAGVNGVDKNDSLPYGLEGAYADGWQAHPDSAGWSYKGQEVVQNEVLAERYPAPAPKAEEPAAPPPIPASQQVVEHVPDPAPAPVVASEPPAGTPLTPLELAAQDGWIAHPTSPGYHYRGQEVVADSDLAARYPAVAAPAPAPEVPAAPPAPAPAVVPTDPIETAKADGWVDHPTAPDYMYKGQEVVLRTDLAARYAGNAAPSATAAASAPAATPDAGSPTSSTGTTAQASASPSDGSAIPAEVQALLNKWG